LLIKFRISGNLRYVSHAEMLRLFQRACVRAGIELRYSQGFNPRPKLSLPLPRAVGVESEDELLSMEVYGSKQIFDTEKLTLTLSAQLPVGCELISVDVAEKKPSPKPSHATYIFQLNQQVGLEDVKTRIEHVMECKSINMQRRIDKNANYRSIDVRPFLKSIEIDGTVLEIKCDISMAGSIRIDEILQLLELDADKLASPIRRKVVNWQIN